jgi:secreted Zn-dependent insulinase-like peptidase
MYSHGRHPPERVLTGPYCLHEYSEHAVRDVLNALQPRSMIMMLQARCYAEEADLTEHHYGTSHAIQDLGEGELSRWERVLLLLLLWLLVLLVLWW